MDLNLKKNIFVSSVWKTEVDIVDAILFSICKVPFQPPFNQNVKIWHNKKKKKKKNMTQQNDTDIVGDYSLRLKSLSHNVDLEVSGWSIYQNDLWSQKTPRALWGPWKCQDVKELTERGLRRDKGWKNWLRGG